MPRDTDRREAKRIVPLCNMCSVSISVVRRVQIKGGITGLRSFRETLAVLSIDHSQHQEKTEREERGRGVQLQHDNPVLTSMRVLLDSELQVQALRQFLHQNVAIARLYHNKSDF